MYKNIFAVASVTALFFTGCGGSAKNDKVNLDAAVAYKTSGAYDFSDYLVPKEKSINVYEERTYENKSGKKKFSGDPLRDTYSYKYDINGTHITVRNGNDEIEERYMVKPDRIELMDTDNNTSLARFVDKGDYILSISENRTQNSIPTVAKKACKVIGHDDQKSIDNTEYSDVLKVECTGREEGKSSSESTELGYLNEESSTLYFAKGKGMVYSEEVSCKTLSVSLGDNKNDTSTCKKVIISLISHNRL